jgi:hypothetical protein
MTSVIDSHETNLDSRALAVDLVRVGFDALMDCDTGRTLALVTQATQGMSPDQLKRLIHQMEWRHGSVAPSAHYCPTINDRTPWLGC